MFTFSGGKKKEKRISPLKPKSLTEEKEINVDDADSVDLILLDDAKLAVIGFKVGDFDALRSKGGSIRKAILDLQR